MKKPTMKEVLELVEFDRHRDGELFVVNVKGFVLGNVEGNVLGNVWGGVEGSVKGGVGGNVWGDVWGDVKGTIGGREWQFVETPKEKAIRLIREGKGEEAIKLLEEGE